VHSPWLGAEVIVCPTMTNTIDRDVELAFGAQQCRWQPALFRQHPTRPAASASASRSSSDLTARSCIRAGHGREVIAVELDPWPRVRRVRERGMHGLGPDAQELRDSTLRYPQYGLDRVRHASTTRAHCACPKPPDRG